ncbi:hypothetical protein AGMMS4952_12410 [Spirochaetia bacterium]|nr:hypothetical protein AGMMS4952_12410 [Spirochaetia bacterium]
MEPYRPLRLILFIYDFIRLVAMARIGGFEGGVFLYAVPNALFTLMSFFLLLRLDTYKPYIPLYLAGKILAVVAFFSWLIFSSSQIQIIDSLLLGAVLLLAAGDILTVLGGTILKKRISGGKTARKVFPAAKGDTGCV